jgi:hypothetical protein
MNKIMMNEPVRNGGDSYFSVRTDRITDKNVFIECGSKDKRGNLEFPYAFYANGDEVKTQRVYNERWGKAYRLYLGDLEKVYFYFTIAWDGDKGMNEGEITHSRLTYEDMAEDIEYYLEEHKGREAYLECCSMETSKKTHIVDLTDTI